MLGRPRRRAGARAGCRWRPRAAQPMTVAASGSSPTSASTCTALRCKGAVAWFCRRRRRGGGTGTVSASTGSACGAGDTGDAAAAAGGQGVRYSMLSILPSSLVLHFQAYSRMLGPFLPHLRSNLVPLHTIVEASVEASVQRYTGLLPAGAHPAVGALGGGEGIVVGALL